MRDLLVRLHETTGSWGRWRWAFWVVAPWLAIAGWAATRPTRGFRGVGYAAASLVAVVALPLQASVLGLSGNGGGDPSSVQQAVAPVASDTVGETPPEAPSASEPSETAEAPDDGNGPSSPTPADLEEESQAASEADALEEPAPPSTSAEQEERSESEPEPSSPPPDPEQAPEPEPEPDTDQAADPEPEPESAPEPAPQPETVSNPWGTSGCDPAYDPCVPPKSEVGDLNCPEIRSHYPSGVRVDHAHGDPHRLDGDKDGYGCEP